MIELTILTLDFFLVTWLIMVKEDGAVEEGGGGGEEGW